MFQIFAEGKSKYCFFFQPDIWLCLAHTLLENKRENKNKEMHFDMYQDIFYICKKTNSRTTKPKLIFNAFIQI